MILRECAVAQKLCLYKKTTTLHICLKPFFYSMTERPTDQVDYILDAYWYMVSLQQQKTAVNFSQKKYISFIALGTDNMNYRVNMLLPTNVNEYSLKCIVVVIYVSCSV